MNRLNDFENYIERKKRENSGNSFHDDYSIVVVGSEGCCCISLTIYPPSLADGMSVK